MITRDLFGQPLPQAPMLRKDGRRRRGCYASRPGTGPKGQRCNTCRHCIVVTQLGKRARKCELKAPIWTETEETNIKHNAPACRHWERKPYSNAAH